MKAVCLIVALLFTSVVYAEDNKELIEHLQAISVTVKAKDSEGSGVIKTRVYKKGDKEEVVNFVWTAGHVVDALRTTRSIVDTNTGTPKVLVEFADAQIVQELTENGRRVGELKMDAEVIQYSDADHGEDLALLRIRKRNFVPANVSVKFYLDEELPPLGTELYHVGSLLGQMGANSLTTGIISQRGRVIVEHVFDQTTCTAFPGSSGGGVYRQSDGRYVGMLVRGAGEGFNFIVPIRRMRKWAKSTGLEFAIDDSVEMPSEEEIQKLKSNIQGSKTNGKTPTLLPPTPITPAKKMLKIHSKTPFSWIIR